MPNKTRPIPLTRAQAVIVRDALQLAVGQAHLAVDGAKVSPYKSDERAIPRLQRHLKATQALRSRFHRLSIRLTPRGRK